MQAMYFLNYKGGLCEIPIDCITAAVSALPDPCNTIANLLETTTELPNIGKVRFTFALRGDHATGYWSVVRLYHLDALPPLDTRLLANAVTSDVASDGWLSVSLGRLRHTPAVEGQLQEITGYTSSNDKVRLFYLGMNARIEHEECYYWGLLKFELIERARAATAA